MNWRTVRAWILSTIAAGVLLTGVAVWAPAAISRIAGLAVALDANPTLTWNNVRDGAAGDNLSAGVQASALYFFDGVNFDRARGTTGRGLLVDTGNLIGTDFFAITRNDITTTSVNLAFGLTSDKILIETPSGNTANVCVNYNGEVAACPAANTAGDHSIAPGTRIVLDDFQGTSVSVVAASGTQTVTIVAWQ